MTTNLTDNQIRIAIAEADQWYDIERQDRPLDDERYRFLGRHPRIEDSKYRKNFVPDYLNDRVAIFNACNDRLKTPEERIRFCVEFCKLEGSILKFPECSARTLCLAFLATIQPQSPQGAETGKGGGE